MKVLKSWLKDYIDIDITDEKIAELLSMSGTAVEEIIPTLDNKVVVAEIKEILPHPNADKLQIVKVFCGDEEVKVVCGANNIKVGQLVPLAQIGTKLGDFEIKGVTIRGEESFGMLCSEKELGIGENHQGIMILDKGYKIGKPLCEYVSGDLILDLEITANRGDCLSHIGIARELAVLTSKKITLKDTSVLEDDEIDIDIKVNDFADCPKYTARKISGLKIGESPLWLQERLTKLGAKPINNVVDITNYVLLDLGQPLHAFDAKKIEGDIEVRRARKSEDIVTLDGEIRHLDESVLVISDKTKAVAIAGIMGGQNTEVSINTTDILLESAIFDPKTIRAGGKDLKLETEASYRFERGIDSLGVETALDLATKMIVEIAGSKDTKVSKIAKQETKLEAKKVFIDIQTINKLLGTTFSDDYIKDTLLKLGFKIKGGMAIVPSFRHDVNIVADLAEEIARIYGYNNIARFEIAKTKVNSPSNYYLNERLKDILVKEGFVETHNYPFLSEKDITALGLSADNLLEIINPIQPENKYLKNSLLPRMFFNIAKNPTFDPILLFEIGHVFDKSSEKTSLAIVASGKNARQALEKAILELTSLFKVDVKKLKIAELKRDDLIRYKIKKPIVNFVEVDITDFASNKKLDFDPLNLDKPDRQIIYRKVSKFPSLTRDLAFIVDQDLTTDKLITEIYSISDLINRVELFDEFKSEKFGQNKKNVAFHIYLQAEDKTLTDDQANDIIKDIVSKIESKNKAKLRIN